MHELIIFGDSRSYLTANLLGAALEAVGSIGDIRVAAVCDTGRIKPSPYHLRLCQNHVFATLKKRFNSDMVDVVEMFHSPNLYELVRKFKVRVVVPPDRNVNHPAFMDWLGREKPRLALSLGCLQIFSGKLLSLFRGAVNYHPSLLPSYRGLGSTSWSLYNGEEQSGFSFHLMVEGVDEGPVLVQRSVPVHSGARRWDIETMKTRLARDQMGGVLRMLADGHPGTPQRGPASYYGRKEWVELVRIEDPSTLTSKEIERRLSAFGILRFAEGSRYCDVTRFRKGGHGGGQGRLRFLTGDGICLEADRCLFLPPKMYYVSRFLRELRNSLTSF
jgi:folate-dependent phosphoribosylglycinamide formyltransferase PurN